MAAVVKTTRPCLPETIPRERLFRLLDRAAERTVVWISAPAGSGKSTLVSSWLNTRKLAALWYQLDAGDSDPATFFYYLGEAAQRTFTGHTSPLPRFTPEYQYGCSVFSKRFFEGLSRRIHLPAVLVFDDFHELPPESLLHQAFCAGIEAVPPGLTVILISREAPTTALSRMKAKARVTTLGWHDLKLNLEETRGLAVLHGMKDPPVEVLRQFQETADGWAAGLVLMMAGGSRTVSEPPFHADTSHKEIFDYFAGELFEKLTEDLREFLLSTAFLPSMTADMAKQLSGTETAGKILSYLCRNHYFTEVLATHPPVYQYHPLFREFLLSHANESFSFQKLHRIKRTAATLLAEGGQFEDAAVLLRSIEDWPGVVALILSQAPALLAQGRHRTLHEWIDAVPSDITEHTPDLLFWVGVCLLTVEPNMARECLKPALTEYDARGAAAGAFQAWSFAIDTFACDPSGVAQLDHWIDLGEGLMSKYPDFPSLVIAAQFATGMLFALAIRQPHRADTTQWATRALIFATKSGDPIQSAKATQYVILYHIWTGDLAAASLLIESLKKSDFYQISPAPAAVLHIKFLEALYSWIASQPEASLATVAEALAQANTSGAHIFDFLLHGQGVSAAISAGKLEIAKQFLEQMTPILASNRRNGISYYYHLAAWHALLCGDLAQCRVFAKESLTLSIECGSPFAEGVCSLMLANALHHCGDLGGAAASLLRAQQIGAAMQSSYLLFPTHLLEALFAFEHGDQEAGLAALRTALSIGRIRNHMNFDGWHPPTMSQLCTKALEANIETTFVREMIRRRKLPPTPGNLLLAEWPWPLKITTFGRFELLRDEEFVVFSGKVQKKPLALLKALIACGGKDVRKDLLSDLLWPESDGDQAHKSFEINLLRLRRLLGNDKCLILQEGRLSLNSLDCLVDVWALDEAIATFDALWQDDQQTPREIERTTQRILSLYKGDFLPEENASPWVITPRERMRRNFLHVIARIGRFWEERGLPETAIDYYLKGLDAHGPAEDLCQRLMICYARVDRPAQVREVYQRCCTALDKLGIKPSTKTKSLYQGLLHAD